MVNSYLKSCFLVFPNYNLGHGLMEMAYNEYINEYYAKIGMASRSLPPLLQGMWGLGGPRCWHIPSACPVGLPEAQSNLEQKARGRELDWSAGRDTVDGQPWRGDAENGSSGLPK